MCITVSHPFSLMIPRIAQRFGTDGGQGGKGPVGFGVRYSAMRFLPTCTLYYIYYVRASSLDFSLEKN